MLLNTVLQQQATIQGLEAARAAEAEARVAERAHNKAQFSAIKVQLQNFTAAAKQEYDSGMSRAQASHIEKDAHLAALTKSMNDMQQSFQQQFVAMQLSNAHLLQELQKSQAETAEIKKWAD